MHLTRFKTNHFISRTLLLILLCFNIIPFAQSQNFRIKGKVIDSETKKPLAFVNIVINGGNYGGATDIDGKFDIISPEEIQYLLLSYVGYRSLIYKVKLNSKKVIIELKKIEIELPEIIILPGENPAHRIINNVIKNRDKNNPEKLKSFSYRAYDKMVVTAVTDSISKDSTSKIDSSEIKLKNLLKKQNLLIMENITEHKFLYPDNNYEEVTASRVSGFKDPLFVFLLSQMQSFSFYDETIHISDKNYINPISKGSIKKYFFLLKDTAYVNNDTVFIISFRPKKNKNFDGMKGVLYINTNGWAIQNVIAKPAVEDQGLNIKIQQKYELIDNKHWFPVQLNTDILFNNIRVNSCKLLGNGRSYIRNVIINPELVKKEFKNIGVEINDDSHNKTETYWNKYRADSLSAKDRKTYYVIDSIGKAEHFDRKARNIETLINHQRIHCGFVDLALNKFFRYNDYEGLYLGLDAKTNRKVSKFCSVQGYWGYGFKDKKAKYGGDLFFLINRNSDLKLKLSYYNDIMESGRDNNFDNENKMFSDEDLRYFLIKKMDKTEKKEASISFRALKYIEMNIALSQSTKSPGYDYKYAVKENNPAVLLNKFDFTELSVGLRYAYKEKFLKNARTRISLGTDYPIVWFNYTKGFDNLLNGGYKYNRFDLKIKKSFYTKYLGESSFQLNLGYIDGNLPYCNLYNGHGSFRKFTIYVPHSFAAMRMNEFLSNRYIALYFMHNFGKLLLRTKYFQPEIAIVTNITFGDLNNKEKHYNVPIKTLEKGYYESGILINNILNLKFYTLGIGTYYRYGPYSFDNFDDNLAFKITIDFPYSKQ